MPDFIYAVQTSTATWFKILKYNFILLSPALLQDKHLVQSLKNNNSIPYCLFFLNYEWKITNIGGNFRISFILSVLSSKILIHDVFKPVYNSREADTCSYLAEQLMILLPVLQ